MKKIYGALAVLVAGIGLTALVLGGENSSHNQDKIASVVADAYHTDESSDEKELEKNIVLEVNTQADWSYIADSIEDLTEYATAGVVSGTVTGVDAKCDDTGTVYSIYDVEVNDCISGEISEGTQIQVVDFGGLISAEEYLEQQTDPKAAEAFEGEDLENSYVEYSFCGAWVPEEGHEYIWYLTENTTYENAYSPVNSYQGIFEVDGDTAERYDDGELTNLGDVSLEEIEETAEDYEE